MTKTTQASAPLPLDDILQPLSPEILSVLVKNHKRFQSFLAQRVGSEALAEDLLQSSLRKAIENPAASAEETSVLAWFFQILKNALIDHYRAHAAEDRKAEQFLQLLTTEGRTSTPALDEIEAEVCKCMKELLPTLKEGYADIINKVDLEGRSITEVSKLLGVTENNLSVRLHRARQALKASLERTCGTCTEHGCLNCTCE